MQFTGFGLKTSEVKKLPVLYLTWKSLTERQASIPEHLLTKNNTDSFSFQQYWKFRYVTSGGQGILRLNSEPSKTTLLLDVPFVLCTYFQ